ncbi:helix-turn-helix domain-containing protein [Pyxidicoccus parkwayensis]|uniref:Helix-turn-helix domain-containing protein n=1 Tax=Pyxidicoccus parkwayensis TaxID=2813578 RepID=A0ABX7P6D2_9BACT|nr:helix-turn-helix domain-containing protein [Pyxidicoccus parkwaysis]QSQ26012.1 helix-turn-helix domain-containing protein [Pyxidicoccus parkwaysis]
MSKEGSAAKARPMRARILERLATPTTAAALARELETSRQKVGYHLKELEQQGLVELVEERRKGNVVERLVKASSRAYLVSAEALASLGPDPAAAVDRFSSAYLIAVAARSVREVATLRERAQKAGKTLPTFSLQADVRFANAKARHAFAEELADAVARLVARHHDERAEGGRHYRLFLGVHPAAAPEKESPE